MISLHSISPIDSMPWERKRRREREGWIHTRPLVYKEMTGQHDEDKHKTNDVQSKENVFSHCSRIDSSRYCCNAFTLLVVIGYISYWHVESEIIDIIELDLG